MGEARSNVSRVRLAVGPAVRCVEVVVGFLLSPRGFSTATPIFPIISKLPIRFGNLSATGLSNLLRL